MSLAEQEQRAQEIKMMEYVASLLETHRLRVLYRRMEAMDEHQLARLGVSREQVKRALRYGFPRSRA
jgi:uncharacterized protein YjiS (DUF1127 family)